MSGPSEAAAAAASSGSCTGGTVASTAAATAHSRIQQATPRNAPYLDHVTGRIKSQGGLPAFWQGLQQMQGWLAPEKAYAYTDSKTAMPDII